MIDKEKIILMTNLAIYDKRYGEKDRKINEYFISDYVYKKNAGTRLYVAMGCIIITFLHWLHKITIQGYQLLEINYRETVFEMVVFILIAWVIYSVIGTKKSIATYNEAQRRLNNYCNLLQRLEQIKANEEIGTEEGFNDGAGAIYSGNNHHPI